MTDTEMRVAEMYREYRENRTASNMDPAAAAILAVGATLLPILIDVCDAVKARSWDPQVQGLR